MNRRLLSDTLVDLAGAMVSENGAEQGVRVTGLHIDVPIEVRFENHADALDVFADLPLWRWKTGFEAPPGRLVVQWQERKET